MADKTPGATGISIDFREHASEIVICKVITKRGKLSLLVK